MTPSGVPEYAITDGTVVPVAGSDADGWNTLGGHAVMVRADYSTGPVEAGDLFYYAHLQRKSPLRIGARVSAGQFVGYAGDTGQGPPGTSGLFPPHLHLGWYDGTGGRRETPSGAMNPYPLLGWIKFNGGAVTGDSDARFCQAPRTGPPVPSGHDGGRPTPANPDLSPDLDADSGDPTPNRAAQNDDSDKGTPARKTSSPDRSEKNRNDTPRNTLAMTGRRRRNTPDRMKTRKGRRAPTPMGISRPRRNPTLPKRIRQRRSHRKRTHRNRRYRHPSTTLLRGSWPSRPKNLPREPTEKRKRTRSPPLTRGQASSEVLHPKTADPLPPAGTSFEPVRRIARARGALQSPCQTKNAGRCDPIPAVY
jgi:Peptidase family M23